MNPVYALSESLAVAIQKFVAYRRYTKSENEGSIIRMYDIYPRNLVDRLCKNASISVEMLEFEVSCHMDEWHIHIDEKGIYAQEDAPEWTVYLEDVTGNVLSQTSVTADTPTEAEDLGDTIFKRDWANGYPTGYKPVAYQDR